MEKQQQEEEEEKGKGGGGYAVGGRATIQRQCVCCRLAGGRGEVFTRVWDGPARRSVVVYSRKESGPRGPNDPSTPPASPLSHRTHRQPAPRFTAIRFLPPLRAFVLSYCRRFCFLRRINLLCLPLFDPLLTPSAARASLQPRSCCSRRSLPLFFDTNEYICTGK